MMLILLCVVAFFMAKGAQSLSSTTCATTQATTREGETAVTSLIIEELTSTPWTELADLTGRVIASFLMHCNPAVSFILQRLALEEKSKIVVHESESPLRIRVIKSSNDGTQLNTYSTDATNVQRILQKWDTLTFTPVIATSVENSSVDSIQQRRLVNAHNRQGRLIGCGDQFITMRADDLILWNADTGEQIRVLHQATDYHNPEYPRYTINSAGDTFLVEEDSNHRYTVVGYAINTGTRLFALTTKETAPIFINGEEDLQTARDWLITAPVFSPDGKVIAAMLRNSNYGGQSVRLFSAENGICIDQFKFAPMPAFFKIKLAFNSLGNRLLIRFISQLGSNQRILADHQTQMVVLVDTSNGKCILDEDDSVWIDFKFSNDGTQLATITYNTIKIWNTFNGTLKHILRFKNETIVSAVEFSRDGTKLFVGGNNLWCFDLLPLLELEKKLTCDLHGLKFNQALLINVIYETIFCRQVVKKRGDESFTGQPFYSEDAIRFSFIRHPQLISTYNSLPEEIRHVLEPYIEKPLEQAEPQESIEIESNLGKRRKVT